MRPPDLQTCLHECRVTAEDDLYLATLSPTRDLKVLDVTTLLDEPEEVSEFESLDLAANMLFLAGECSYFIARELSCAAQSDRFRRNGLSVLFQHTAQWCEAV